MIGRALLLVDGPSDTPLADHLENLCARRGREIRVTTPDLRRLRVPPGMKLASRIRAVLDLDGRYELLFVHRDSEKQDPKLRYDEVKSAVDEVCPQVPATAIVPVRMTEAWLLVDEGLIREVAGRPGSTVDLFLPPLTKIEANPDPKDLLKRALVIASGLTGRRLKQFQRRFSESRRLLLEQLDVEGPVRSLPAWQALEADLNQVIGPPLT